MSAAPSNPGAGEAVLQVCETFLSIQGESTWAGTPCFFIRLAGCNLRCAYCDTAYAWSGGRPVAVGALVDEFKRSDLACAEVTGGEPLLQAATPVLLDALFRARPGVAVLLETNGSQDISAVPPGIVTILDIKCPGSGEQAAMEWANLDRLRPQDEVKFVIGSRADFEWAVRQVAAYALASKCHAVLFSPIPGRLSPADMSSWLLDSKVPARLNVQLHKLIGVG